MKPCPSCARRIQDAATKCHYCGAVVRPPRALSEIEGRSDTPAPAQRARPQVTKGARTTGTIIVLLIVVFLTIWWIS